jgi:hypothetical protein
MSFSTKIGDIPSLQDYYPQAGYYLHHYIALIKMDINDQIKLKWAKEVIH